MKPLEAEVQTFIESKESRHAFSTQLAALFLTSGIDLGEALRATPPRRREIRLRVERLIERERLRGAAQHWSYDLNRHIALKQALRRLADLDVATQTGSGHTINDTGGTRRRRLNKQSVKSTGHRSTPATGS